MLIRNFALVLAVSLFSGCASVETTTETSALTSQAAEAAPAVQPVANLAPKTVDEDEVICKVVKSETGTRLGEKEVCLTRKHWQDRIDASKREIDRLQTPRDWVAH